MKRITLFILISFFVSILVVGSNIYIDKVYEDVRVGYSQCTPSPEKTYQAQLCIGAGGDEEECLKDACLLVAPKNLAKTKDYIEMTIWFFPLLLILLGGYYTFSDKNKNFKKALYGFLIPTINGLLFVIMLFIWGFSSLNSPKNPMRSEDVFVILGAYLIMLVLSFGLNSLIYIMKRNK